MDACGHQADPRVSDLLQKVVVEVFLVLHKLKLHLLLCLFRWFSGRRGRKEEGAYLPFLVPPSPKLTPPPYAHTPTFEAGAPSVHLAIVA